MTKVLMNADLVQYQLEMKEALRQVIQQNYVGGAPKALRTELPLLQEDLLPPPCILYIYLDGYTGQGDDFIGVMVSHDFGICAMHIAIRDEHGNLIERGEVSPSPKRAEAWSFFPEARVPSGTRVIVQVTAMDCMEGVGTGYGRKILE